MPNTAGSSVAVCIVSHNSAPVLLTTLESIETHVPTAAVMIREHGTDSDSLARVEDFIAGSPLDIDLSTDETNPGFGAGCNALALASTANWLLFLNPDAVILEWPWNEIHTPPRAAVVGPSMDGAGETERQSGISYRVRDEVARSWLRKTSRPLDGRGFVSGAALLIDRASFERIGGFDERYFMFYEDIDLCLRANDVGIATFVEPRWRVRHTGGHATKDQFERSLGWSFDSALRFHAERGSSTVLYRAYAVIDGTMRGLAHLVLGHRDTARSYRRLARRALRPSSREVREADQLR